MSTTVRVTGYLYAEKLRYGMHGQKEGDLAFHMLPYKDANVTTWGACIGPVEFEHTLPEGLDIAAEMVRQQIVALEAEKAEAGREYVAKVAQINERLSKLQALTCEAVA